MEKDRGAVMENINDIRADCGLGRQLSFHEIKSLCNTVGVEGAVQKVCAPGQCIVNADCDDGNSCTIEFCSTGLRGGCITGTPVGDGTSCQIGGQLGECEGATCVPDCDQDNDGWDGSFQCAAQPDCDDNNPNVNPDAAEVCNGIDDDCDGLVDNVSDPITGLPIC